MPLPTTEIEAMKNTSLIQQDKTSHISRIIIVNINEAIHLSHSNSDLQQKVKLRRIIRHLSNE